MSGIGQVLGGLARGAAIGAGAVIAGSAEAEAIRDGYTPGYCTPPSIYGPGACYPAAPAIVPVPVFGGFRGGWDHGFHGGFHGRR